MDLLISQICDMDFSFSCSCPSILQQFSGVACRMPYISDQVITALHHILVCADDGSSIGDGLQIWRIKQGVKSLRQLHRFADWIIWSHQYQRNSGAPPLGLRQHPNHQAVKASTTFLLYFVF